MKPPATTAAEMWQAYLRSIGEDPEATAKQYSSWYFADNRKDADELIELVVSGQKKATASSLWELECQGEPLPRSGDLSVVTDWAGHARAVIQTTRVTVLPFDQVSVELAALEGEGDLSLEYWRWVHLAYYERVLTPYGCVPSQTMPVVFEEFALQFP